MFETIRNSPEDSFTRRWWPDVSDGAGALAACRYGMAVTLIVAVVTAYQDWPTTRLWSLVEGSLFTGAAVGLYRGSRLAAVAALLLFAAERIAAFINTGATGGMVALLALVALGHAVRGAFAYQRLSCYVNKGTSG
jgi:hypothetical protein